jgi:quercetin dioxygenase-like cupin family protein
MAIIDATTIEGVAIPAPFARTIKVLLAPDSQDEVKDLSITMMIIAPHSRNDLHTHKGTEILYIATGFGQAVLGEVTQDVRADALIVAPGGVPHQQINDSDETMKVLCIWTPAVPGSYVLDRARAAAAR